MKKHLTLALSLLLVITLSSCSSIGEPENVATIVDIEIVNQYSTQGDGYKVVTMSNIGFVDNSTSLNNTFPVYINDYPYGQEGPLYNITDSLKNTINDNLARYLGYLYDRFDAEKIVFSSDQDRLYELYYTNKGTEVRSQINSISILSRDYPLTLKMSDADILNNALVKAAVAYLGLTNPTVSSVVEYGTDGSEYLQTYKIFDSTSNTFQHIYNNSFECITVQKYADSNNVIVKIRNPLSLTKYADYPVLPYEAVIAKLVEYYPNMDTTDIEVEIFYSGTVQPGYFLPCYRFYFKDNDTVQISNNVYSFVDVLLTDRFVDN